MSGQLKEVRERISSVTNTQQITKAMKMVSAAKLRKAQDAIVQMRPYSERLDGMLRNILFNLGDDIETSLGKSRDIERALVIVVTSSKGLCGAFNSNIIKAAVATISERFDEVHKNGNLTILCIGKKGHEYFKKRYTNAKIINDYVDLVSDLSYDNVAEIGQLAIDEYENGQYDSVTVSYGRFKNTGTQFPETEQFLPVAKIESDKPAKKSIKQDYIFEPDKKQLLDELIPSILKTTLHRHVLDTHASEHGARMTAMDKATENAKDMLKDLKISYNKARQEAITRELSEIVAGATALQG